jgi:hypothetical protein
MNSIGNLSISPVQCYRLKDQFPFCQGVPYGKLPLDSSQLLLDSSQLLRPVFTRASPPFIHIPSDHAHSMPSSSQRHSPKDAQRPQHSLHPHHHHHHHHHQLTPQQQQQQQQARHQQQHYQRGRSMSPNPRALAKSVASTRQSSGRQRTGGGGGVIIGPAPAQYAAAAYPPMELYTGGGTGGGAFYPVYPQPLTAAGLPSPGANHPRHAVIGG